MNILALLRSRFHTALASLCDDPTPYAEMVKPAQDPRFGDFQANCAMPLAGKLKAKPHDVAERIVNLLAVDDLCLTPEIAGPGFINLRLRDDWLAECTNRLLDDERLGVMPAVAPRTYIVDYSAPNVAKPMHVGHLRSSVIGAALCRMLAFAGHRVVSDNHIGDWGTQFGMIIYGYKHFLDQAAYQKDAVGELARLYRLVNQLCEYHEARAEFPDLKQKLDDERRALAATLPDKNAQKALSRQQEKLNELAGLIASREARIAAVDANAPLKKLADAHPEIVQRTRSETARLHAGDARNRALWNEFLPRCLEALERMYARLGIHFDLTLGESFYDPMLAGVVADLEAKKIATHSEGAVCIFLDENAAPFIIRKSDGAFTYATTDLATIKYRVEQLHADVVLYVVDARQSEHFRMLFAAAARWGYDNVELKHVSFGTILGEDKRPFKTRSGDTVGLESLLDEAVERARKIVDANDDAKRDADGNPATELDDAARRDVAEAVGIGGIKYADLRHNRESDYVFSWDKMLALTGDTATYMQYVAARINGIFRKGDVDPQSLLRGGARIRLSRPEERAVALALCGFATELDSALREFRPNILTQYLFQTANCYSTFYENCPVLKEPDPALRQSRLLLCELTGRVVKQGLDLLGIRTCERM